MTHNCLQILLSHPTVFENHRKSLIRKTETWSETVLPERPTLISPKLVQNVQQL